MTYNDNVDNGRHAEVDFSGGERSGNIDVGSNVSGNVEGSHNVRDRRRRVGLPVWSSPNQRSAVLVGRTLKLTEMCNGGVDLNLEVGEDFHEVVSAAYIDRSISSNILSRVNEVAYHNEPQERYHELLARGEGQATHSRKVRSWQA